MTWHYVVRLRGAGPEHRYFAGETTRGWCFAGLGEAVLYDSAQEARGVETRLPFPVVSDCVPGVRIREARG